MVEIHCYSHSSTLCAVSEARLHVTTNKMKEGPSESALQVQASNCCSDALEVTSGYEARTEKAGETCQVRMKEMSESEPFDEVSRTSNLLSKPSYNVSKGRACRSPVLLGMWQSS